MNLQQSAPKGRRYQKGRIPPDRQAEYHREALASREVKPSRVNRYCDRVREVSSVFWGCPAPADDFCAGRA